MTLLLDLDRPASLAAYAPELERAAEYASASRAANTRKAYEKDLASFIAWCKEAGLVALPADGTTVARYLAHLADRGLKVGTMGRMLTALSQAHKLAGFDSPRQHRAVRETFAGIRRTLGTAQRMAAPLLPSALHEAAAAAGDRLLAVRDRALLAVGLGGGFRRSELVSLDVADLEVGNDWVTVNLRRSKTDQEGAGRRVAIPYGGNPATCPVRTLRAWLAAAGITEGAVFRSLDRVGRVHGRLSDRSVANIVKAAAKRAGLDPERYSGHSLRAGLATAAAQAGKSERVIMQQTGHRSERMVRRYIREVSIYQDNAAVGIGL